MGDRLGIKRAARRFVEINRRISQCQDSLAYRVVGRRDGQQEFVDTIIPRLVKPGMRVLDVGGGRRPQIDMAIKRELSLRVVGLDISADELAAAPPGAYDETIVGDVASVRIEETFDLILSCTVLEHVKDTRRAIPNLAAALREGGTMAHFMPCRNTPFAVVNRWLGNRLARKVLFTLFPDRRANAGFEAFYDQCVPSRMRRMCAQSGLVDVDVTPYFSSGYASFFAPLYAVEVTRQVALQLLGATNCAESLTISARKPPVTATRPHNRAA